MNSFKEKHHYSCTKGLEISVSHVFLEDWSCKLRHLTLTSPFAENKTVDLDFDGKIWAVVLKETQFEKQSEF